MLNILEKKYIIPEFLQFKCRPNLIAGEIIKLIKDKSYSKKHVLNAKKSLAKLKNYNNELPSMSAVKEII